MVFIVVMWLIRLLPHCFDVDEPFPLLYCTAPPALNDIHSTIMCLQRSYNDIHSPCGVLGSSRFAFLCVCVA